jgi:hypothetical protein
MKQADAVNRRSVVNRKKGKTRSTIRRQSSRPPVRPIAALRPDDPALKVVVGAEACESIVRSRQSEEEGQ